MINQERRLTRSSTDRMLSGVSGGIAAYLNADPTIIRLLWIASVFVTGPVAALAYLACWFVVPQEELSTTI